MHRKLILFLIVLCLLLPLHAEEANWEKYYEALRLFGQNKPAEAISACKEIIAADPTFWRAYFKLVEASLQLKQLDKAQDYFQELRASNPNNPYAYYGLGQVYGRKQDYPQAIAHYKRCIELGGESAELYQHLVGAYLKLNKSEEAVAYLEGILKSNPESGYAHYGLGVHYYYHRLIGPQKALFHLDNAIKLKPDLLEAYSMKGSLLSGQTREYEKALQVFETLLGLAEKQNDVELKGQTLNKIGNLYYNQRDYEQARAYYQKALTILQQIGDRGWEASVLNNMSEAYYAQGNYGRGLEYNLKSLEIGRQLGQSLLVAISFENMSVAYLQQGNVGKALEALQTALKIYRQLNLPQYEVVALSRLGRTYYRQGRYEKALQCYQKILAMLNPSLLRARPAEGLTRSDMGMVYRRQGRYEQALTQYQKSLAIGREIDDRLVQVGALTGLGTTYYDRGDYAQAIEHFRRALKVGNEINTWEAVWESHVGLARALEKQGPARWEEALAHYRSAVETIKALRSQWQQPEDRVRFLQNKIEVYERLCHLLVRLYRQPAGAGQGYDREAFRYAEESRARALVELLEESRASVHLTAGLEAGLAKRERALRVDLSDVQTQLEREKQSSRLRELEKRRDDLYHQYENLIGELRRRHPRYAQLRYPEAVTVAQCQNLLDQETVLLEYLLGEESSLLFAVSREGYDVVRLAGRKRIEETVRKLMRTFTLDGTVDHKLQLAYVEVAGVLYNLLIRPGEKMLKGKKRILLAPDGVLYYLPFQALLTEEVFIGGQVDFKGLPYLVKQYAISYIQSASVLSLLTEPRQARPDQPKKFLAFADPAYQREPATSSPVASLRGNQDALLRSAYDERGQSWKRLPYSGEEARGIAGLYPKEAVDLFLREEATEENVKQAKLWEYERIHFAAHSLANEARPQFSGIVLTTREGSGEDGYLQMYEIFNLRLNAQLVALSGCETGLGKQTNGEGMMGLIRAFLYAGAENVLATLWKIEDRSTAELMRKFYAGLEAGPMPNALRSAQLDLINRRDYSHPYFWGAFALYGGR